MELYEEQGMCRIAASAIALTCRCIMQVPDAPASRRIFAKLVLEVNDFFLVMEKFQIKGTIIEELRRYHKRCLSFIAARMKKLRFTDLTLPEPLQEENQSVPWRYIDWRTGRIMETPLRLESGEVVDRGTLLIMMLSEPFRGHMDIPPRNFMYEPMPELQEKISIWKEQQKQKVLAYQQEQNRQKQEHQQEDGCQE
ncbi:hypothetical protein E2C01_076833 [Portunus trituberculatus]|uniref:Uncharacterized protein n=1 Tax=Portunus trituberculatus TaxID=210409 RepID=A0A5B7IIS5_PORTR|nr:hypothetical protein [Portunus trituberculatus]